MRYRSGNGDLVPIIVLIILNFLVYLAVNIANFAGSSIIQYLALSRLSISAYPWTIFTYMFTHQDFFHILFNMLTLYFFGQFLNRIAGTWALITIFLVGGLVSGLVILVLSPVQSATIGASGAIFALGGALAVMTPQLRVFIFPIPAPMPLWVAILVTFIILALIPGVSWQGHLGGLLFGCLAGWYLRRRIRVVV